MKIRGVWQIGVCVLMLSWGVKSIASDLVDDIHQLISFKQFSLAESLLASDQLNDFQKGYFQGLFALEQGDISNAMEIWQTLHARYPEQLILGNNLAVLLMRKSEVDKAQAVLERSLNANRDIAMALENLNKIYSFHAHQSYSNVFRRVEAKKPEGEMLALTEQNSKAEVIQQVFEGQQSVMQALETWRSVWSAKDVSAYLGMYHAEFVPANNQSQPAWRSARTRSLQSPRFIEVSISALQLMPIDQETVRVQFQQRYRSDRFEDQVVKVLILKQQAGDWKIIQETVINEI